VIDQKLTQLKLYVVKLADELGVPVQELLLQVQQEIQMDAIRRVLIQDKCSAKRAFPRDQQIFLKK
jgi:hypothetical protein